MSVANCCEHNELSEVEWVSRRERRPAFFAGRNRLEYRSRGVNVPPPGHGHWSRPRPQGSFTPPAAGVPVRLNECGIAPVESLEPTLTKTAATSVACTRSRSAQVGHHVHDPGAVLVAVNASALRADRDAASGTPTPPRKERAAGAPGIDRSCPQRAFRI
jgi:hypothetical protein